ncbi:hypothetical protein AGMMS49944_20570 [Spirochaetia bacterium]|nr:hypothetical protein AGMMS49944_20570 [Spirochaetia bacterium]
MLTAGKGAGTPFEDALDYLEAEHFTVDTKKRRLAGDAGGLAPPDALGALVHGFPGITFTFDLFYWGSAAGCEGNGRYFCVFEQGNKV